MLRIIPIPAPRRPMSAASYINIRRISFFWVPMLRRTPISLILSVTDIIMMLKMETAATRREMLAIMVAKLVMVERVDDILLIILLLSWTRTVSSLRFIMVSMAFSTSETSLRSSRTILTWLYSSFAPYKEEYRSFVITMALSVFISMDIPRDSMIPDTFTPFPPTLNWLPTSKSLSDAKLGPIRTDVSLVGYPPEVRLFRTVLITSGSTP